MFSRLYGVLLPFFVSFLLAYVLDPIVVFIQTKCKVRNRALAVLLTLLLVVGLVVGAIASLRKPVMDQVNSAWVGFQAYIADFNINDYVSAETQEKLLTWTEEWSFEKALANPELTTSIKELLPKIGNWITGGLSWMSELLVVFIGFMYLIFLMIDMPNIRAKYSRYVPRKNGRRMCRSTLCYRLYHHWHADGNSYGTHHRAPEYGALYAGTRYTPLYRPLPPAIRANRTTRLAHATHDGDCLHRGAIHSGFVPYPEDHGRCHRHVARGYTPQPEYLGRDMRSNRYDHRFASYYAHHQLLRPICLEPRCHFPQSPGELSRTSTRTFSAKRGINTSIC